MTPLQTRADYTEAALLCNKLSVRRLSPAQREYFRELLSLVESYEDKHGETKKSLSKLTTLTRKR